MKKLLILALPLLILFVGFAKAQCVVPYENMEIASDTVFCEGTYYLNDSDKNSSILISGNNIVVDCNNSFIIGASLSDSIAIKITGNNVTLKNCNIYDFNKYGIYINSSSNKVYNCSLSNILNYGIYLENGEGNFIENCSLIITGAGYGIYLKNSGQNAIQNCLITGSTYAILAMDSYYLSIKNNSIVTNIYGALTCCGSHDIVFEGNYFDDTSVGISIGEGSYNIAIKNNEIRNSQESIGLIGVAGFSGYGTQWVSVNNVTIIGNVISNSLADGILIINSTNILIRNNTLKDSNIVFKYSLNVENLTSCENILDGYNYIYGIMLTQTEPLILKNVMRPDSDSCSPHLSIDICPRSMDYREIGNVTHLNLTISTNLLDTSFSVSKVIDVNFTFNYTKDLSNVSFECYDSIYTMGSVSCSQFSVAQESKEFPIPFESFELLPFRNSHVDAYLKLHDSLTGGGNIIIKVLGGEIYDQKVFSILAPAKIILPFGLGLILSVVLVSGIILYVIRMFSLVDVKDMIKLSFLIVAIVVLAIALISMIV